jgi:NADH-quinone oxidoreductase subunit J
MTGAVVGFWVAAAVLVLSALVTVLTPNLFHAVLTLALALVATGGVFLLLASPFLFGVQLLLYAGGVVTIVVFAIMLTERLVGESIRQTSRHVVNGAIVAAGLLAGLAGVLLHTPDLPAPPPPAADAVAALGRSLLGPHVLTLELLAVLLVAALLGALYFARPDE